MNIITGYRAEPHYSGQQMRDENIALYGVGTYILNVGSKLAATVVSANEITIADGLVVAEGCTAEVARGTSESIAVENGEQGMLRKDLIVLRYTKDVSTNIEDMQLHIIKGTSASANPVRPSYTSGSIAAGDTLVEFPLYEVNISGITITSVERLVGYAELASKSALTSLTNTVTNLADKVGNTAMGTAAATITGAIRELLTKINTLTSNLSTTNTNLNTQKGRIDTLASKTSGLVSFDTSNVTANSNGYRQLTALGMYLVMVNGASTDNGIRGMYLVGTTTGNALGIKAISTASNVTISDGGSGLLKIANASSVTVRLTIIRVY